MTYMEQIITRLSKERKALGLSQADLSSRMGKSAHQSTIGKIELGQRNLSIDMAHDWCEAVGLRLSDLIAALDDGKSLVSVPKTVEVDGHVYTLKEDADE